MSTISPRHYSHLIGISELMLCQVVLDAPVEDVNCQKVCQHADDGGPFVVGDCVKIFQNFCRMIHRYGDRMGCGEGIWK